MSSGQPFLFAIGSAPVGAAGLLLSPGRGLLFYSPVVLLAGLALVRPRRSDALRLGLVLAIFLWYLVLHSTWRHWDGGWSWGPRFLLPALPGLCAVLGRLPARARGLVVALALAGFLVSSPLLITPYARYFVEAAAAGREDLVWSVPDAPFVQIWPATLSQLRAAQEYDPRRLVSDLRQSDATQMARDAAAESPLMRILNVWWWVLPVVGIPRWAGLLAAAALTLGSGILAARTLARARRLDAVH